MGNIQKSVKSFLDFLDLLEKTLSCLSDIPEHQFTEAYQKTRSLNIQNFIYHLWFQSSIHLPFCLLLFCGLLGTSNLILPSIEYIMAPSLLPNRRGTAVWLHGEGDGILENSCRLNIKINFPVYNPIWTPSSRGCQCFQSLSIVMMVYKSSFCQFFPLGTYNRAFSGLR